mgnify:CR=1 FL=1
MTKKIKIALVDDFNVMRTALANFMDGVDDFEVVFQAETKEEFISKMEWENKPNVIIMDYNLGEDSGVDCIKHVREEYGDDIYIIGLSMYKDLYVVSEILNAGANGFLFKGCSTQEIIDGIRDVCENGFTVNKYTSSLVFGKKTNEEEEDLFKQLNDTEKQIIKHICLQETNEQMARELNLSLHTVNSYRKLILKKLKCKNSAGLVLFAVKNGIFHI